MRNFQTLHTGCLFLQLYDRTTAPTVMGSSVLCPQLATHRTDSLLPHTEGLYIQFTTLRLKDCTHTRKVAALTRNRTDNLSILSPEP